MNWLMIVGISLANNLDNTGVGFAYGVGNIRIPFPVNLWISVITLGMTGGAVALGSGVSSILPPYICRVLSAGILCTIGVLVMRPAIVRRPQKAATNAIAKVLADPASADVDGSRHIDFREGTLLGVALSINNVGGGISAGLIGLSVLGTAATSAAISFLVLWGGGVLGRRVVASRIADRAPIVAGVLLIVIGILQFR